MSIINSQRKLTDLTEGDAVKLIRSVIREELNLPIQNAKYLTIDQAVAYINEKYKKQYTPQAIRNWWDKGRIINYSTNRTMLVLPDELDRAYLSLGKAYLNEQLIKDIAEKEANRKVNNNKP